MICGIWVPVGPQLRGLDQSPGKGTRPVHLLGLGIPALD